MIPHVAEKGEQRGRVLLQLGPSGRLSHVAVEAAFCLAEAFQSEVESLFVEDVGLLDVAGFAFSREISFNGQRTRKLALADIERELQATGLALQRAVAELAKRRTVPLRCRTARDHVVAAVARACAEHGPWNVVAIAEPLHLSRAAAVSELLAGVEGTTGILVAGPNARHTAGPVVAILESLDLAEAMLRAAERIAAITGGEARLLVAADGPEEARWIEGQLRLALGHDSPVRLDFIDPRQAEPLVLAGQLRRLHAGFVIVQLGGVAAPTTRELAALASQLEGPVLVVR